MPARLNAANARCSIARSLEVLGERWSLLIVRDAFEGSTRFSQFRSSLGVAADILTARLATLVDAGVLERRPYREDGAREREEYVLTDAGRDLARVLGALIAWGDEHRPSGYGPAVVPEEIATGQPVALRFVTDDGRVLDDAEVRFAAGPGRLRVA